MANVRLQLPKPDPKRPQLWTTKHPFDEDEMPQTNLVYPDGKYEFYLERKRKWHLQGKDKWTPDPKLDTFVANL